MKELPNKYRLLEFTVTSLNAGFQLYLGMAPTILLALAGLLLFSSIRFWHSDYISNLMFPTCVVRCLLDALTPFASAGIVRDECRQLVKVWMQLNGIHNFPRHVKRYNRMFLKSCKVISCKAGSLYVMKSSILTAHLNHMAQLTLNLLIAYPSKVVDEFKIRLDEVFM